MLKNILEKIYLLLIIIAIGGYSAMSMLTIERESIYAAEDPLLFKFFVGLLFILTIIYITINNRYLTSSLIKHLLLLMTSYLAISKIAAFPPTAGILSYVYHPIQMFLIMTLYATGQIISAKSKETLNFFSTYMLVALLILAFFYYKNWSYANLTAEAHLGTSYYALFLLLPILFSSKKWIKLLAILITILIIMSSLKRGGVVALIMGLVAYLFVKEILLEFKIRKFIWFIVLIFGVLTFFICIDNYMGNIISGRLLNITNDAGSGRDQIWRTTWDMIRSSYVEYLLLGHGYSTVHTNSPLGFSAHNDFLEVLYNWGIVMFIPYVVIHIALIKQVFVFIRNKNIYASALTFSYTIFFVLSMISIVILYPLMGLMALTWGVTSNLQESTKI